jgi:hypothetical protein
MKRIEKKNLPKGFRHLLAKKEIKQLEAEIGIRFFNILFGHHLQTATFNQYELLQSNIHPISISGWKNEAGWQISIAQSGFREELLPKEYEEEIKQKVQSIIKKYVHRLFESRETDFITKPQLWVYVLISNGQAEVKTREIN